MTEKPSSDKEQRHNPRLGPYVPPVIYDPKRGVMVDSKTGETVMAPKKDKPWEGAPRTDAIWRRHTEDAAALEDRLKELGHYYEMASHACDIERELAASRSAALEEAAKVCEQFMPTSPHTDRLQLQRDTLENVVQAIRALKGNAAPTERTPK